MIWPMIGMKQTLRCTQGDRDGVIRIVVGVKQTLRCTQGDKNGVILSAAKDLTLPLP